MRGSGKCNIALRQQQGLPGSLQLHIVSLLPPNDKALSARFISRDLCQSLGQDGYTTASLSDPLPPHAAPWAIEVGEQHMRQLPFERKLQLLCTAAASGSEANLEVAWALLQPSVFPEALERQGCKAEVDPGVAALSAGHPQVLGWLVLRCPGLLSPKDVLEAAAEHCDLAALQGVWGLLLDGHSKGSVTKPQLGQGVLDAAARSATPDAVAKVEWVLGAGGDACCLLTRTARAAITAGQMGTLRWLQGRGCPMCNLLGVDLALEHADLAMAQWLVDEAGCGLPEAGSDMPKWMRLMAAAASSPDGVAKLQWLQQRGGPPLHGGGAFYCLAASAARSEQVEVIQHLLAAYGPPAHRLSAQRNVVQGAVGSGSVPTAECLRQAGMAFGPRAYLQAAEGGHLAMVRWLAREVGVSTAGMSFKDMRAFLARWLWSTQGDSRGLLEAVQLLVGAGFCSWHKEQQHDAEEDEDEDEDEDEAWDVNGSKDKLLQIPAAAGDLALVQYVLMQQQRQRPQHKPDREVLLRAAGAGCEVLLEWLVEEHPRCRAGPWYFSPYEDAALRDDRGTLEVLRRLGMPWGRPDVVVQVVRRTTCNLPALRWLVERGAPIGDRGRMRKAVAVMLRFGRLGGTRSGL